MRIILLPIAALLLSVLAAPAVAEPVRRIGLPREGLTVDVPDGWTIDQYGDVVLELEGDGVTLRVGPAAWGGGTSNPWTPVDSGGARRVARVDRAGEAAYSVTCEVAEDTEEARAAADRVIASMDTTPYANPNRHVDWSHGWTLDVPEGWVREANARHAARFASQDGTRRIEVEDLSTALDIVPPARLTETDLDAQIDRAWRSALAQGRQEFGVQTASGDAATIETLKRGEAEARRATLALKPGPAGGPKAWLVVLVTDGLRAVAVVRGEESALREIRRVLATLVEGTHPGPQAAGTTPTDSLPGGKGPPVAFTLPDGWSLAPGSNSMRLAQASVDGSEVVVFYFGAGGGGAIADNLKRWRDQMGGDEGTTEVRDVAPDVKVHWLDVAGAYSSQRMGGGNPHNPHDPHGEPAGQDGQRMLAAVLEVPDGPLFIKFVGPKTVIDEHAEAFRAWIDSFRVAR